MPGYFSVRRRKNMMYNLNTLIGSPVTATDGEIGCVRSFLFDDQSWKVEYLVVDVGNWLKRKEVVLPITVLEQPDWAKKICHAHLTKEQVHGSPEVDAEMSVSRQQEIAMHDYFGPLASWVDKVSGLSLMPTGTKYPLHTTEVLHLRNSSAMLGYHVQATDGDFGILEDFIMDEARWHLGYLDVKSGDWLQNRSVMVPTRWVESVSWAQLVIQLHHPMAEVQDDLAQRQD
jgi:uncharacterized protein YrrD